MSMSRQELDGHLAALGQLNGNKTRKTDATTHHKVKSLRQKRKPKKHGR